jgi:cell division protein ZapE
MAVDYSPQLLRYYHEQLQGQAMQEDAGQVVVVGELARLSDELVQAGGRTRGGWLARLAGRSNNRIRGVYIHGGVGRGKTWLMDMFHDCLPLMEKRRVHYHEFMKEIHTLLGQLPRSSDPLKMIARQIADSVRVLCLDEFHVNDIADAMILSGLLEALFRNHVVLVVSSNVRIDDLYRDGLQRERFLPAIGLLKEFTNETGIMEGSDYRMAAMDRNRAYCLLGQCDPDDFLESRLQQLATATILREEAIHINNRDIRARAVAGDLAWFDFEQICGTWRSASDYVEIARCFQTVFIDRVMTMSEDKDSEARRFINLIDALYDNNVSLYITAEMEPALLYTGRRLRFAFERTASRLVAMGKLQYLERQHHLARQDM